MYDGLPLDIDGSRSLKIYIRGVPDDDDDGGDSDDIMGERNLPRHTYV